MPHEGAFFYISWVKKSMGSKFSSPLHFLFGGPLSGSVLGLLLDCPSTCMGCVVYGGGGGINSLGVGRLDCCCWAWGCNGSCGGCWPWSDK